MTRINSTGLALAAVVAAVATARGAGYALYEGSARGNVDAAGLAAGGGEPGALYFNPATITDLDGTQIQLGFSAIYPRGDVETTNPYTGEKLRTETDENLWNIPSIFVTHAINDSLVFGFGAFARFGLGAEIDPDWPGRYNSYKAIIQAVDLNPNLAWKVNDKLSVSAGVTIRHFDIELAQKIDEGAVAVRYHTLDFLNRLSASGDYSSRAAGALMCVADSGNAIAFSSFHGALFAPANQPAENGKTDHSNADLAQMAKDAGADDATATCVADGAKVEQATAAAQAGSEALAATGARGTPTVVKDGVVIDAFGNPDWVSTLN